MRTASIFVAGAMFGAFCVTQIASPDGQVKTAGNAAALDPSDPVLDTQPGVISSDGAAPSVDASSNPVPGQLPPARAGLKCQRGANGGATDIGVTGDTIQLATTDVESGPGQSFLGDVKYAMEAVRVRVNQRGGICGRLLKIKYVDDGWDAQLGAGYLRNFMHENVFAIPVAPSSEGLRVVIDNGDIRNAGIPVVGTDGMLIDQYRDPWVWSVAVPTASTARIMAIHAYAMGARNFSIVFDKNYRFGVEAAEAFNSEVKRLTHKTVPGYNSNHTCQESFCGVLAAQSSYGTEINTFKPGDLVAMFLEPTTALTWMASPNAPTARNGRMVWGAQPLFTRDFANGCQDQCHGMWIWSSYKPPINEYTSDPHVRQWVEDLKQVSTKADENNAFAEGGYVGMELLVQALEKVGPDLTRARLKQALDSMPFDSGITLQKSLSWTPGNHFAAATCQAFEIQFKGTLGGWRAKDIVKDPTPQLGLN